MWLVFIEEKVKTRRPAIAKNWKFAPVRSYPLITKTMIPHGNRWKTDICVDYRKEKCISLCILRRIQAFGHSKYKKIAAEWQLAHKICGRNVHPTSYKTVFRCERSLILKWKLFQTWDKTFNFFFNYSMITLSFVFY